uniref:NADH dehydrogenase [ubiquinone] 1 alpha subcomplex subunit 12 n=1 Tax=Globodera rostochiensis TaxID=31243 RepID=A0A914HUK8_GLORO
MPPTLKEYFFLDKLAKAFGMLQRIGGLRAAIKQRYLTDANRAGDFVGEDKFGNRYFEEKTYFVPRDRYVVYPERVWLDYDASMIPPEWHRWLHHICDKPPTIEPPAERKKWMMEHRVNSLEMADKYVPYSTTRPKVEGWVPGGRKGADGTH